MSIDQQQEFYNKFAIQLHKTEKVPIYLLPTIK